MRYTDSLNDPRIDAAFIDKLDAKRSYFGATYHYIIRTSGVIEIARDPRTRSSAGKRHLHRDHIYIGVVGGLEPDGKQSANETPEQEASLEWLMQALADTLGVPLEVTDSRENLQRRRDREEQQEQQDEQFEGQDPHDDNGNRLGNHLQGSDSSPAERP